MTAELERVTVVQPPRDDLGYVAGFAITDELIIAAGGTSSRAPTVLASSNGRHFEPRTTPRELGLRDVLVVGELVWTCGEYGQLASSQDRGASWSLFDTGTDACLFGLALASDRAVWVVGDRGYAARVIGDRLERVELATTARLAAIYAVHDELVVLGVDGSLRRWRGGRITTVATGTTTALGALAITKHGTWIVVGDHGFVARSPDGRWFSRAASGVETDLEALAALGDGRLVAVGDRGQILISSDDGRTWRSIASTLTSHLWAVEPFGGGVLIGGDGGLVAKLAPHDDQTWEDRVDVFGGGRPFDRLFAGGPEAFVTKGLGAYLDAVEAAHDDDRGPGDGELVEPADAALDHEAFQTLGAPGDAASFAHNYGVAMPVEASELHAAVLDRRIDLGDAFDELRIDNRSLPDVGEHNLFELLIRRDQRAYLGTGLVEAFCGVFGVGLLANGDSYHMELYEWDGRRQVLHYDHETHAFTGVFADSLDSLVYLAALCGAKEAATISQDAFAAGLRKLRGRIAPSWHFSIGDHDPAFPKLDPKRRDVEFLFYRSRWICALLKHDGITDVDDISELFMADFNQTVPLDQLAARFDACERFIPTALYSMWRAFAFDEPELARYLEIGRRHEARLVRDAAALIDELRAGRNELGTIDDVRAHLAAFRALDLDPRRAEQRELEAEARASAASRRTHEVLAQLAATPRAGWTELAWQWLDDGIAHRTLLEQLDRTPELAEQIAALDALRELSDNEREIALPRLASRLGPELEAVLVGSLVRGDALEGALVKPAGDARVGDLSRVRSALAMTDRALRLVPGDRDAQLAHAMLLLDAERAGIAGKLDALLCVLPELDVSVRIVVAVRMSECGHARFGDVVDALFAAGSDGELVEQSWSELADAILAQAPERLAKLIAVVPGELGVLATLASRALRAGERVHAVALYERVLALPIPDAGAARVRYLDALAHACAEAHAASAHDTAVRIADRAQSVAHEHPCLYHSAARAYAAVGDHAKAFHQIELAIAHDYDRLDQVEVDPELGPLLDRPELVELFRDWHARREGN